MKFLLYHHKNRQLAEYVVAFSSLDRMQSRGLAEVEIVSFPQQNAHGAFAELAPPLRRLVAFAKPDVVVCFDDGLRPTFPVFAFEATVHVPARDHWLQRFMNLVGPAQERVPGAYIMPFQMPNRSSFREALDSAFFYVYDRIMEIHEVPIYIAEWSTLSDGQTLSKDRRYPELPDSSAPDIRIAFEFLNKVIDAAIHGRDITSLRRDRIIVRLRNKIRQRAYQRIPEISDFARLCTNMPGNRMLTNRELRDWLATHGLSEPPELPDRIVKRDRNLVFSPQVDGGTPADRRKALMVRIEEKGGDPYTPQPLAFDYMFCRLGPTPYERDASVVIDLTVLKFADLAKYHRQIWLNSPLQYTDFNKIRHVPTYTMYLKEGTAQVLKNFLRVYAYTADIIAFEDALLYF